LALWFQALPTNAAKFDCQLKLRSMPLHLAKV
jgi:hypothetical protein